MRKPSLEEIRFAGTVNLCNRILGICCTRFKNESGLYHLLIKKKVNSLLDTVLPLMQLTRSEKLILEVEKIDGIKVDREDLNEEDLLGVKVVEDFIEILMRCNPVETFNLSIALDNLKSNKVMYTQEELDHFKNK